MNKGFSLRVLEDNSEIVNYTTDNLPIRSVTSVQEDYPTLSVVNHWHNDLEFSYVTKRYMLYSVNGERAELNEGDVIFVNSARLHYGYWEKKEECEFLCVLFGLAIAMRCGFVNSSYFAEVFWRYIVKSPKQFQYDFKNQ